MRYRKQVDAAADVEIARWTERGLRKGDPDIEIVVTRSSNPDSEPSDAVGALARLLLQLAELPEPEPR